MDELKFTLLTEDEFKELDESAKWNYVGVLIKQIYEFKVMAEIIVKNACINCKQVEMLTLIYFLTIGESVQRIATNAEKRSWLTCVIRNIV